MAITVGSRVFQSVDDLEKLVIHAATEYELNGYVEDFDGTEITDPEYDALVRELRGQRPDSKAFKGTSPSEAAAKGRLVKHNPPMTSIQKADGDEQEKQALFDRWLADCATRLGTTADKLLKGNLSISYKRDGVSVRINYKDGKLVSAGLRPRDGVNGSDITRHVKYLKGVPQTLPLPLTLSLNGEIECWLPDFEAVNADQDAAGEDPYKNPRNYTAGCMGRDDPEENKDARLRVTFHSITGFDDWHKHYSTEVERAKWANGKDGLSLQDDDGKGFFVQTRIFKPEYIPAMEDYAKKLPYYTDGLVIKVNDLQDQEELGHIGDDKVKEPRGAIAWKYEEETAIAVVSSIEWNASRTGRVVPTAIFDTPFKLADTDNTRATCNNYGWMESQGLGPGAKVEVKKGGKIIPNIMRVIDPVQSTGAPTQCPSCGSTLHLHTSTSGNKDLLCKNAACPAKHVKSWIFYIQNLGGKGLGAAAMEKILNGGKVRNLAELYDLTVDDLVAMDFSERQATLALATIHMVPPVKDNDKLKAQVEKARTQKHRVPAWQFFAALGIPGAGKTAGKALVQHFKSFDKIRRASVDDLLEVDGIGDATAQAIHAWFSQDGIVDSLLAHVELELPKTGKLTGTNFVLTGAFDGGKETWQKRIEDEGGNVQSSVGSKTNYLVAGDKVGKGKTDKAAKLGVPVITVDDLEKML